MRKQLALKNSIIGLMANVITMIVSFICTRVFMHHLGVEIKGINGLLTNCLGLLQLAELGIGNAIIYALYKPLVDNNTDEINKLMRLFAQLYRFIGIAIIVLGIVMSFFLEFFINDSNYPIEYIRLLFYIQLIASVSTYFMAYKRNLIYADQKMYVITLIDAICELLGNIAKISVIILFNSYIFYLFIQIIQTITANVCINIWCNQHYPYLKDKVSGKYDKMPELKRNVRDIMIGKIGGFIYSSTDNLIISKFVGIIEVGYMSVYYQIQVLINMLASSITAPIQPMLGNYIHQCESSEETYDIFMSYTFIRYCMANLITVGMITLMNPLVSLWMGQEYVLSLLIPVLMACDLFIGIVHGATGELIQVLGLFKSDRNLSYGGMMVNLVLSIIFVTHFGTIGVLMGTAAAQMYYWLMRGYILFKNYYKKGVLKYILRIFSYIFLTVIDCIILHIIEEKLFPNVSIINFIFLGALCVVVSLLSIALCFFKTTEFKTLITFINILMKKEEK